MRASTTTYACARALNGLMRAHGGQTLIEQRTYVYIYYLYMYITCVVYVISRKERVSVRVMLMTNDHAVRAARRRGGYLNIIHTV